MFQVIPIKRFLSRALTYIQTYKHTYKHPKSKQYPRRVHYVLGVDNNHALTAIWSPEYVRGVHGKISLRRMASVHNYIKDAKIGPSVSTRFFFINIGKYVVSYQNTTRFGGSLPDSMYERCTHTRRAHNANEQNLTSTL